MNNANFSQRSNRYGTESACEHCQGITEHEPWCMNRHARVLYAYEIIEDASRLSFEDGLILHSLGVVWADVHH